MQGYNGVGPGPHLLENDIAKQDGLDRSPSDLLQQPMPETASKIGLVDDSVKSGTE